VAFVSLSNMPGDSVRQYVEKFSIPWPCGHGVSLQTVADFGAFNSGPKMAGYEVTPTVYLVGADGRVRWSDRQRRLRHEDRGPWLRELAAELEEELSKTTGAGADRKP
jgi:hypothetical protein